MTNAFVDLKQEECCGCNACGDTCSAHAITFRTDVAGFQHPFVNTSLCVGCGKCRSACPVLSIQHLKKQLTESNPTAYAAIANDIALRFDSTSGGIFSLLARSIFSHGGFVGGASWGEDFSVHQLLTQKPEDLVKLQNSKYIQSNAQGFYAAVKSALTTKNKVLVCGLPCQMAALRAYLGQDFENLFTIDLICRSVASPAFLKACVKNLEREKKSKVIFIKQKDKGLGWRSLSTRYDFDTRASVYIRKEESLFMQAYCSDLISRESCRSCNFKGFPRMGDITLADCWGAVDKLPPEFDHDLGTSMILCNTPKGHYLADLLKNSNLAKLMPINPYDIVTGNFGLNGIIHKQEHSAAELVAAMDDGRVDYVKSIVFKNKRRSMLELIKRSIWLILTLKFKVFQLMRLNGFIKTFSGQPLIFPDGRLLFQLDGDNAITTTSDMHLGCSMVANSTIESRFRLMKGSSIKFNGGSMGSGAYILIFENGELKIGKRCSINIGFSVTCGRSINIGDDVYIGQNVSIRDTHGDHFINTPGYENTRPVEIGDHVWITSGAMIMPGVKIGSGSVIAAKAVVTKDVPPHTLVAGIPAKVIRENIQFRC